MWMIFVSHLNHNTSIWGRGAVFSSFAPPFSGSPQSEILTHGQYIYPEYERIFAPVKTSGKTVILLSDGNISTLAHDIAPIVDGFIFEVSTPADFMFKNFGGDKCLIGGIDSRVLTFGTEDEVEKHVKEVVAQGRNCPGYVIAASNTIPANIPLRNVDRYFNAVEKVRKRGNGKA